MYILLFVTFWISFPRKVEFINIISNKAVRVGIDNKAHIITMINLTIKNKIEITKFYSKILQIKLSDLNNKFLCKN
jgi:hypothetical protein